MPSYKLTIKLAPLDMNNKAIYLLIWWLPFLFCACGSSRTAGIVSVQEYEYIAAVNDSTSLEMGSKLIIVDHSKSSFYLPYYVDTTKTFVTSGMSALLKSAFISNGFDVVLEERVYETIEAFGEIEVSGEIELSSEIEVSDSLEHHTKISFRRPFVVSWGYKGHFGNGISLCNTFTILIMGSGLEYLRSAASARFKGSALCMSVVETLVKELANEVAAK